MTVDGEIRDATGNIIDDFDGIIDLTVFDNKETVIQRETLIHSFRYTPRRIRPPRREERWKMTYARCCRSR